MQTAVEWLVEEMRLRKEQGLSLSFYDLEMFTEEAKEMEKRQMLDFGEFIIDELEPGAQNRDWVEEKYDYFKLE